jgi:hypothetical protein
MRTVDSVHFNDSLLIKKQNKNKKAMGDFSFFPLDGTVSPTAACQDWRTPWLCSLVPPGQAQGRRETAALPGPGQDGTIRLCRLNQGRTENGQELKFQAPIWF